KIELPQNLKKRGLHDVFHASLLRIHVPNDDRLFPGRLEHQVADFGDASAEWAVDRIISHSGSRSDAMFEVQWTSGDITWLPYSKISHLEPLAEYLEALGFHSIAEL
ncbi:hypothetical protein BT96DRAFT_757615, partial [Gymnopus androsaceus JB14]